VRRTVTALLMTALVFASACDPGITIHQVSQPHPINASTVFLSIKTTRSFIGSKVYAPQVTVADCSASPILLTMVDLIARDVAYESRTGVLPLTLQPGQAETFGVLFDLHEDVKRTFERAAEFRLHYQIAGKDELAQTDIVGGSVTN
jgi:hypothetical protein